jgi:hypothetical protein
MRMRSKMESPLEHESVDLGMKPVRRASTPDPQMGRRRCPYCGQTALRPDGPPVYLCCAELQCLECRTRLWLYLETPVFRQLPFNTGASMGWPADRRDS